jgi:hypothetical protein
VEGPGVFSEIRRLIAFPLHAVCVFASEFFSVKTIAAELRHKLTVLSRGLRAVVFGNRSHMRRITVSHHPQ